MSLLKEILSSLDTSAPTTSSAPAAPAAPAAPSPVSRPASGSPKPAQRAVGSANSALQPPPLKRKASGPVEAGRAKTQRRDASARPSLSNGGNRPAPSPAQSGVKPSPSASTTVPYRGTAGLGAMKSTNTQAKRLSPLPSALPKAAAPAPKPSVTRPATPIQGSASPAPARKPGGYMAMLLKAKEKDQTKPAAPPVKHEPTKIMNKKDRLLAREQAKAQVKGKKPAPALPGKSVDSRADLVKEKRKPAELGYQGTARPAKKPVEIAYRGTAKPNSSVPSSGKPLPTAARGKSKPTAGRYGGYADWSDVGEESDEGEDDYASDASSDMEGDLWDVEQEETEALKVAKKEDAAALAEETRLKREKEERKRKLMAMNKAAASKRKY